MVDKSHGIEGGLACICAGKSSANILILGTMTFSQPLCFLLYSDCLILAGRWYAAQKPCKEQEAQCTGLV